MTDGLLQPTNSPSQPGTPGRGDESGANDASPDARAPDGGFGVTAVVPAETRVQPLEVRELEAGILGRWNDFVARHPAGTFFHRAEWRTVLARGFRQRGHYLYVETAGTMRGVLPLGHLRSRLFGNALISTPFCVYGGILAADEQAHRALERAACDLARRLEVDYLEMRNRRRLHPAWPCKDLYVTFRKALEPAPQANLQAIPRKQRAMVRKGLQAGLRSEIESDLARFYRVYSESVRDLGTPVLPRRYFEALREAFGEDCEVLSVYRDGSPLSSVMSFYWRDEVLPYYGGGTREARSVAGNDFMYWEVMRRAAERGLRLFDYGRSKRETGAYHFKRHWGFEPEPLFYEYHLVRARAVPDINPLNPRYRLFIELWKRLPLRVSQWLGPPIASGLG